MWEMILCLGVTWAGCGASRTIQFPTQDACFVTLREVKVDGVRNIALCQPANQPKPQESKK
jgi:hypothetical protein